MTLQETKASTRLMLLAMMLAASYISMRTVGDTLFLSRVGSDSLALVFLLSGVATALLAWVWFALTRHLELTTSLKISAVSTAGLTMLAWLLLPNESQAWWLLPAIYLLTELKGCICTINVITAANELLGGHSSRRAWAKIGLGVPFAGFLMGLLIWLETSVIDLRSWLLIAAVLELLAILPMIKIRRWATVRSPRTSHRPRPLVPLPSGESGDRLRRYACSRQFRFWIGLLMGTQVVVLTLINYFWKVEVTEFFGGDEESLTSYFGLFYGCIGVLTILFQVVITARLMNGNKLLAPIMVLPISLTILSAMIMAGAGALILFVLVTLAKSLDIWRRSAHDSTMNFLYTRIERAQRRTTISLNTAVVKPLAEVSASLILLVGPVMWHKPLAFFAGVTWLVATAALAKLVAEADGRQWPSVDWGKLRIKQIIPGLADHQ